MRIANIVFKKLMSLHDPLYQDGKTVLLVSDDYRIVERARLYKEVGINAEIYPLSITDSPTLFSLLGITRWIHERSFTGIVVVEGYDQLHLLQEAYRLIFLGVDLDEASLYKLSSPLHARSLIHLSYIRDTGINLAKESQRFLNSAFTGGDAHKSTVLEIGIDIAIQLSTTRPRMLRCIQGLYMLITGQRNVLGKTCSTLLRVAEALDFENTGAVKNIALITHSNYAEVVIGCKLLMEERQCWPEAENAQALLSILLNDLGLGLGNISMLQPEETACIAYNKYIEEECKREDIQETIHRYR